MAELYRRIRGISHTAVAAVWLLSAAVASAQEPGGGLSTTAGELEAWASALSSDAASERAPAVEVLSSLEAEALPAIRARVGIFRPLPSEESYDALRSFRHVLGSRRADDMIDIGPGVPLALAERRDRVTAAMAERVLLLRSLESIGGLDAVRLMADVFATDAEAWRWEMRRVIERMGARAVPGLIVTRNHPSRPVRSWARASIERLGMAQPGLAVQQESSSLLADLLRAYGETKDMDAMPVVVSMTTHERAQVREAARWATEQYGQNAIWQLRRVYRNLTEEDAERAWGWRRTMTELYRVADARRLEPVRGDLSAGSAALARADLAAMERHYDAVLRAAPDLASRAEMAPGYAALAARALAEDRLGEALTLYRRAARLAPDHASASTWRAEIAFIEAEQALSRGVVDLGGYEQALVLAPHAGAADRLAILTGREEAEEDARTRRWAALCAALLLALAAFFLLRRRRPVGDAPPAEAAADTLPG